MAKALSVDLRIRVLAAVAGGMTHRAAAERFGVSAASVSRWRALKRIQGDVRPGPLGGDRRSGRIEAQRQLILSVLDETPDITIRELCTVLGKGGRQTWQRHFPLSFGIRVLAALAGGMTHRAAAERFGVSAAASAGGEP